MTTRVLVDNCIFSDANMLQGAKLTRYKDKEQTEVSSLQQCLANTSEYR
jgi:hypothetical protein